MTLASADFNARLARIAAGQRNASGKIVLHVGEAEVRVKSLQDLMTRPERLRRKLSLAVVMLAVPVGGVGFAAAEFLRARFLPGTEPGSGLSDAHWAIGLGLGVLSASVLAPLTGVKGRSGWSGLLAGVVLASMSLHNLAFFAPDKAKLAFGLPWVQRQLATTEPASLVFRTEVYTL